MRRTELSFGERNFAHANLGDQRRTRRLVKIATSWCTVQVDRCRKKINSPNDLKAMYRLFDCEAVTHAAILDAHRQHLLDSVLSSRDGFTLVLHDATEMGYTKRRSLTKLGEIAK